MTFTIVHGDSIDALRGLADASVDALITDPPYGLSDHSPAQVADCLKAWLAGEPYQPKGRGFMRRAWDAWVPGPEVWRECLRVMKPGAYMAVFAGTRSLDLMMMGLRLAGVELRDTISFAHEGPEDRSGVPLMAWVYGSGWPKSKNGDWGGTALKPAWEPIILARKPLAFATVDANFEQYGTGGLNIDAARIETGDKLGGGDTSANSVGLKHEGWVSPWMDDPEKREAHAARTRDAVSNAEALGRWPANLAHDGSEEIVSQFPVTQSGTGAVKRSSGSDNNGNVGSTFGTENRPAGTPMICHGDSGSAARYFYTVKKDGANSRDGEPSANSENRGVVGFKPRPGERRTDGGSAARFFYTAKATVLDRNEGLVLPGDRRRRGEYDEAGKYATNERISDENHHPTVKPTDLMRWLCRLLCPAGGTVADPFMGSGSTGKGALLEGFHFWGCDAEAEYVEIARRRLDHAKSYAEGDPKPTPKFNDPQKALF